MITHFHGVDKHSTHLTITTVDQEGNIVQYLSRCTEFSDFIDTLSETDAVAIETGNMTFHLADLMEEQGATVFIVDARANKIISSSTRKTDKNDSEKLAYCLRSYLNGDGYTAFPTVYKPTLSIRRLRRMFSGHETLKKSLVQLKNTIIGMLRDSGLRMTVEQHKHLFHPTNGMDALEELHLFPSDEQVVRALLKTLHAIIEEKKALARQIIQYGAFVQDDVELLISIKGVSPLLALGFLADVGDVSRFTSIRRLNAYLGLVPVTRSSGKREFQGHIIRCSRHLTRTLFTQAVQHIGASSPHIATWYKDIRSRRGVGRGRIALIRKTVKIMRRMLLERELYRWTDTQSYQSKLLNYYRILNAKDSIVKIPA
jgi:transposase